MRSYIFWALLPLIILLTPLTAISNTGALWTDFGDNGIVSISGMTNEISRVVNEDPQCNHQCYDININAADVDVWSTGGVSRLVITLAGSVKKFEDTTCELLLWLKADGKTLLTKDSIGAVGAHIDQNGVSIACQGWDEHREITAIDYYGFNNERLYVTTKGSRGIGVSSYVLGGNENAMDYHEEYLGGPSHLPNSDRTLVFTTPQPDRFIHDIDTQDGHHIFEILNTSIIEDDSYNDSMYGFYYHTERIIPGVIWWVPLWRRWFTTPDDGELGGFSYMVPKNTLFQRDTNKVYILGISNYERGTLPFITLVDPTQRGIPYDPSFNNAAVKLYRVPGVGGGTYKAFTGLTTGGYLSGYAYDRRANRYTGIIGKIDLATGNVVGGFNNGGWYLDLWQPFEAIATHDNKILVATKNFASNENKIMRFTLGDDNILAWDKSFGEYGAVNIPFQGAYPPEMGFQRHNLIFKLIWPAWGGGRKIIFGRIVPRENAPNLVQLAAFSTDIVHSDADGVDDADDNCPLNPNADQMDTDNDSIGDACDNCPRDGNNNQADRDNDGIGDQCDNCIDTPNRDQRDADRDFVGDACDCRPNEPNSNRDADQNGVDDVCQECVPEGQDRDGDKRDDICSICTAQEKQGLVEWCGDGIDNNCNGQVDENCQCNPGAVRECGIDTGECVKGTETCRANGTFGLCSGKGPVQEVCDGLDNDCDGIVDDGWQGISQIECTEGVGACAGKGHYECKRDGISVECVGYTLGRPSEEVCDGIDNDCDGEVDENLAAPVADKSLGVCAGSKKACAGLVGWGWENPKYTKIDTYQEDENLCDGLDNDCDGEIDEGCQQNVVPPQGGGGQPAGNQQGNAPASPGGGCALTKN